MQERKATLNRSSRQETEKKGTQPWDDEIKGGRGALRNMEWEGNEGVEEIEVETPIKIDDWDVDKSRRLERIKITGAENWQYNVLWEDASETLMEDKRQGNKNKSGSDKELARKLEEEVESVKLEIIDKFEGVK